MSDLQHLKEISSHGYHPWFVVLRCAGIKSDDSILQINLAPFEGQDLSLPAPGIVSKDQKRPDVLGQCVSHPKIFFVLKEPLTNVALLKHRNIGNSYYFRRCLPSAKIESALEYGQLSVYGRVCNAFPLAAEYMLLDNRSCYSRGSKTSERWSKVESHLALSPIIILMVDLVVSQHVIKKFAHQNTPCAYVGPGEVPLAKRVDEVCLCIFLVAMNCLVLINPLSRAVPTEVRTDQPDTAATWGFRGKVNAIPG